MIQHHFVDQGAPFSGAQEARAGGWMPIEHLIWVKGIAGMANRIQSLLTAILYARLTGRRVAVDWTDQVYSPDGRNVFHELFQPLPNEWEGPPPAGVPVAPACWEGRLHDNAVDFLRGCSLILRGFPCAWYRMSIDPGRIDYPEPMVVYWSSYDRIHDMRHLFRGENASLRDQATRQILRELMEENLKPVPAIQDEVRRFREEHLRGYTVGIHIRWSDKKSRRTVMLRRLEITLARHPDATVFVATDNAAVLSDLSARFARVVSIPKWYPSKGASMHINKECPDKVAMARSAIMDLELMGCCDELILDSQSSYSLLVRIRSRLPQDRVFDAVPWHRLPHDIRRRSWVIWQHLWCVWHLPGNACRVLVQYAKGIRAGGKDD